MKIISRFLTDYRNRKRGLADRFPRASSTWKSMGSLQIRFGCPRRKYYIS